jgi:hypothetical protein
MKVKELIALLQKENPEARVIKYNDGGTTLTSPIEGLSQPPVNRPERETTDGPTILIE